MRVEPSPKRVRVYLGGLAVADSLEPKLVWEIPYYPTYYFPANDVRTELLSPTGETRTSRTMGEGALFTVRAGEREAKAAAVRYDSLPDLVRFTWDAMDAWFEEDEEVFTHARDPYSRIDVLASSRHVRVDVDSVTVAESSSPRLLFETGLPTRYYLPKTHVRMDLLQASDKISHCPYKGQAEYWSLPGHADVAWSYRTPLLESQKVASLIAFYNERVDIFVDGVGQPRPS